jgi:hypothetical protein
MGRVLSILAAIGLLTALIPATATAAAPTKVTNVQTGIRCEMPSALGHVGVFVEVFEGGTFGSLDLWAPDADPLGELPVIITAGSIGGFDGTTLTSDFDLVTADEAATPVGTARLVATLTPAGPLQDFGSRTVRDGNTFFRQGSTLQLFTVTGSVAISLLDGRQATVALENCGASTFTSTFFGTNPDAWVYGEKQVYVACDWLTDLGQVSLTAISEEPQTLSEVVVVMTDTALVGLTTPDLSPTSYLATHELFDLAQGTYVGAATATATLTATGQRITENTLQPPHRMVITGERLAVDGTLSVEVNGKTTVLPMDDTACRAGDVRYVVQEKR